MWLTVPYSACKYDEACNVHSMNVSSSVKILNAWRISFYMCVIITSLCVSVNLLSLVLSSVQNELEGLLEIFPAGTIQKSSEMVNNFFTLHPSGHDILKLTLLGVRTLLLVVDNSSTNH